MVNNSASNLSSHVLTPGIFRFTTPSHSLIYLQFTVQDVPLATKVVTPRLGLVPQRGTIPRPPLTTTLSSASNRKDAPTAKVTVYILKLYNAHHHRCRCQRTRNSHRRRPTICSNFANK